VDAIILSPHAMGINGVALRSDKQPSLPRICQRGDSVAHWLQAIASADSRPEVHAGNQSRPPAAVGDREGDHTET
jgi:hypothetical protein